MVIIIIQAALSYLRRNCKYSAIMSGKDRCNLPEYPGNQEDVETIKHIQAQAAKIEKRYARTYKYLKKMITELAQALNQSAEYYTK